MKNATLLKIASLFIFLLSAQFSFGQTILTYDNFNQGFGNWNDPGYRCELLNSWWSSCLNGDDDDSGTFSVRLRRNTSSSRLISDQYDFSSYSQVKITYNFATSNAPDSGEGWFIEYSDDNGSNWETVKQYINGVNFTENQCVSNEEVLIEPSSTINFNSSQILLRFRNNMNKDNEQLWLDNIKVEGFSSGTAGTDILFFEDQADASQSGSTISGSGTSTTNASGITWTMNDPGGDVKVHNGDHIHCSKLDGDTVTWETGDIIISGYTNLNFTVFARKIDDFGSSDYIKLQYSIDGGTTRVNIATYNTNLTNANIGGDINTLTSTTVAGDTLKIYIEVYIDDDDQKFEWEDITLTGTPFYNVWQGTESDLVTNTAKWSKGSQPTEASNVWIPNTKHLKLTDDQAYNTVNARATSQLTIEKTGSLTTVGDFTKIAGTGAVTLNSDSNEFASIIVEGTATGEITYNKYINYLAYQEWDLVGSPVLNQNMQNFAQTHTNSNNTNNTGSLAFDDPYYALGEYLTEWGSYSNYTTSTIPNSSFPAGKGYQMATNPIGSGNDMEGQTLAFTGDIATTSQSIDVQNLNGTNNGYGRRWNLVANPYPSYISAQAFFDTNSSVMGGAYTYCYVWRTGDETSSNEDNGEFGKWGIYNMLQNNLGGGDFQIAPGQAFYVAAASSDVAQIQFTPSMRTVTGGDDFINGAPVLLNYKLDLKLYNGSAERAKTKFHFQQGLTLGLEPAYDAAAYNQAAALSSRLPEDDQGVNFQLNAMNIEAAYNQTIPLVVNQQEGQSFRISISNNTLPEDINVYLEDVFNGTLTSLKNQDFELVAQEDLSQDGRFYIRFTTESLAVNDVLSPSSITVFKLNTDNFITIKGLSPEMGKTTATLYNMLGMKVREKTLNNTAATQQISTQGLSSGVYIINLKAGEQAVSKKVIIQ